MNRFPEPQPPRESSLRKEERMMLSPTEFVESYASIGEKKASAPLMKLFLLAILAGFAIGMGGAVTTMASFAVENGSVAKLLSGILFPLGLIMVILTGAELFTGNCLMTISLLERRIGFGGLFRNLAVVYAGNFVGAALLAAGVVCGIGSNAGQGLALKIVSTAAGKCALPFGQAVVLGILCNLLVCIAVMCSLSAKSVTGRAVGAFGPVCCFVICGFEHCVANMYFIPAGLLALANPAYAGAVENVQLNVSALTWGNFFACNLVPVTLGNILGGCAFAALIWFCHRKKN